MLWQPLLPPLLRIQPGAELLQRGGIADAQHATAQEVRGQLTACDVLRVRSLL